MKKLIGSLLTVFMFLFTAYTVSADVIINTFHHTTYNTEPHRTNLINLIKDGKFEGIRTNVVNYTTESGGDLAYAKFTDTDLNIASFSATKYVMAHSETAFKVANNITITLDSVASFSGKDILIEKTSKLGTVTIVVPGGGSNVVLTERGEKARFSSNGTVYSQPSSVSWETSVVAFANRNAMRRNIEAFIASGEAKTLITGLRMKNNMTTTLRDTIYYNNILSFSTYLQRLKEENPSTTFYMAVTNEEELISGNKAISDMGGTYDSHIVWMKNKLFVDMDRVAPDVRRVFAVESSEFDGWDGGTNYTYYWSSGTPGDVQRLINTDTNFNGTGVTSPYYGKKMFYLDFHAYGKNTTAVKERIGRAWKYYGRNVIFGEWGLDYGRNTPGIGSDAEYEAAIKDIQSFILRLPVEVTAYFMLDHGGDFSAITAYDTGTGEFTLLSIFENVFKKWLPDLWNPADKNVYVNMIPVPSAQYGSNDSWQNHNNGLAAASLVTKTDPITGVKYWKALSISTNACDSGMRLLPPTQKKVTFNSTHVGKKFAISFDAMADSTHSATLYIRIGASSEPAVYRAETGTTGNYTFETAPKRYTYYFTPTTTGDLTLIQFGRARCSSATTDHIWVTNYMLREYNEDHFAYVDGNSEGKGWTGLTGLSTSVTLPY